MKTNIKTHVGAYALIIENDRVVLIKKARGGYKGKLDLPGGGIEHDETPTEAVKRECLEEAGVNISDVELLDAVSNTFKWQMTEEIIEDLHHIGIIYKAKIGNQKLKEDFDGLDSFGAIWIEISSLNREMLSPFAISGLEKAGYNLK